MFDGIGKFTFKAGGLYHGYFSKGLRSGQGLFHYPNRDRYRGNWKYGKRHGYGTYIIDAEGIKLTGTWFEGQLRQGEWKLANGDTYTGEFKNNKPIGLSNWTLANGNQVQGVYEQSILDIEEKGHDDIPIDPSTGLKIKLDWTTHNTTKAN